MKGVQKFTKEYLEYCKSLKLEEIVQFIDDFQKLYYQANSQSNSKSKSKLISIKIPQYLLNSFRTKAKLMGIPYQTLIKRLMEEWLIKSG